MFINCKSDTARLNTKLSKFRVLSYIFFPENKAIGVMKPGHCFTIEPMISQGTWRDDTWPDKWTAVTADGLWSAQFEHTLLVNDTGCEILTKRRNDTGLPHFMDKL